MLPNKMSLFPTKDSLIEALADIEEEVGPDMAKRLFPLLMAYHNTLIKEFCQANITYQQTIPKTSSLTINL